MKPLKKFSVWRRISFYDFNPESAPEITFWYAPLSGENQTLFRRQHKDFDSAYDLMEWLFRKRVKMFSIPSKDKTGADKFVWPEDPLKQEALFGHIPKNSITETGAAILGWKKSKTEDAKQFVNRITKDLKNSMEM